MKNFFRLISFVAIILWADSEIQAQVSSFKALSAELQTIKKNLVPDSRVALLDLEIRDTTQRPIVIKGETNLADAKSNVLKFFSDRYIQIKDSIRVLPDEKVGIKTWALVNLSVANLRAKPGDASELVSQALLGTPLKVLDYSNKWYRVQTQEGYIGWMDSGGLLTFGEKEYKKWKKADRCIYNRISGYVYSAADYSGEIVSDIVLGDLLVVEDTRNGWLKISFPDGREGFVNQSECILFGDWIDIQPDASQVIDVAKKMMGFPYLWGGTSSKGMDCSGFVKTIFYSLGVILARDASQQARYGAPVDFSNIENLRQGDLLFFGRSPERITHVGIYISDGDFIHSSGRVHIANIIPGNPKNDPARNLVAVRRILGTADSAGIIPVKMHDWYIP